MSAFRAIRSTTTSRKRPLVISLDSKKTIVNQQDRPSLPGREDRHLHQATPFADVRSLFEGVHKDSRPIDVMPAPKEGGTQWKFGRACWASKRIERLQRRLVSCTWRRPMAQ
jgi:hypothetical protein